MISHLLLVVNPRSGNGRAVKRARAFLDQCTRRGINGTIIDTLGKDEMIFRVSAELLSREYDGIIIVGGDGLFHALLPLLQSKAIPFTVIAAGTGNDFARAIGTFKSTDIQIIEKIQSQEATPVDSIVIGHRGNETIAGQVVSLGFDALVNERANQISYLAGKIKYVIAMLQVLTTFKPIEFTINVDGKEFTRRAMLIVIANGPNYGGGMKICPPANHSDGVLDLVILNEVPLITLIRVFPRVYTGSHTRHKAVELHRGQSIMINADAKAFADGEYIDRLPLKAAVAPGALKVWTL